MLLDVVVVDSFFFKHETAYEIRISDWISDVCSSDLWIVDGQLQRLLYFWMIRDLVTDFAYDWISGVIRDDRTQCEGIGRAMRSNPTAGVLGILFWHPIEVEIPHYQEGDVSLGVFTGNVGHGKWFVTFSMTAWRIAAGPAVTWARLDASGPAGDSTAYSTSK